MRTRKLRFISNEAIRLLEKHDKMVEEIKDKDWSDDNIMSKLHAANKAYSFGSALAMALHIVEEMGFCVDVMEAFNIHQIAQCRGKGHCIFCEHRVVFEAGLKFSRAVGEIADNGPTLKKLLENRGQEVLNESST